jgi:hypothetical protein
MIVEAAAWLSKKLRRVVWPSELSAALKRSKARRGYGIRYADGPDDKPKIAKPEPVRLQPEKQGVLLRYPYHDTPLNRGLPKTWR